MLSHGTLLSQQRNWKNGLILTSHQFGRQTTALTKITTITNQALFSTPPESLDITEKILTDLCCGTPLLDGDIKLVDHLGDDCRTTSNLPEFTQKMVMSHPRKRRVPKAGGNIKRSPLKKTVKNRQSPLLLRIPHIDTVNQIRAEDIKVVWDSKPNPKDFFSALGGDSWSPKITQNSLHGLADELTHISKSRMDVLKDRMMRKACEWNCNYNGNTDDEDSGCSNEELMGHMKKLVDKEITSAMIRFKQNSDRFGTTLAREAILSILSLEEDGAIASLSEDAGLPAKTQTNRTWLALDVISKTVSRLMELHHENKELRKQLNNEK